MIGSVGAGSTVGPPPSPVGGSAPVVGAAAVPGMPTGPFITGGGGYWEVIDRQGVFGLVDMVYDVRIVGGTLEITTIHGVDIGDSNPRLLDYLESQGLTWDSVEDTGVTASEPSSTGGVTVIPGGLLPPLPGAPPATGVAATAEEIYEAFLVASIAILTETEETKIEAQEKLAAILRRVTGVGPAWDKLRAELKRVLEPIVDDIDEGLADADLPDFVEDALDDITGYVTDVIYLDAVPIPIPVPGGVIPPWFIVLLLLLEILWFLAQRSQSTTYPPQRQSPPPGPRDQEQDGGGLDQNEEETPQPRIILPVVPIEEDVPPPVVTFSPSGCITITLSDDFSLETCRRKDHWTFTMTVFNTVIQHEGRR